MKIRNLVAAAAIAALVGMSAALADDDQPLNAAGPVGATSGHQAAVRGLVILTGSAMALGGIIAVLVNDHSSGNGTTATTGTTGTTGTH